MAVFTGGKQMTGAQVPENAVDMAAWRRTEPLVTPDRVRTEFLFGIPLVAAIKDPITGKAMVMTDPLIQRMIEKAVTKAEREAKIDIFPVERKEKHAFDIALYNSFGYMKLHHRPASRILSLTVTPSNNADVYSVNLDWVETNYLMRGQVNIVPLVISTTGGGQPAASQSAGGAAFLAILGQKSWVPAFWQVDYVSGFEDGKIPVVVNELIATIAAMDILSQLAATHAMRGSYSLGLDGGSQSISTPGPQIFKVRLDELQVDRDRLTRQIRSMVGNKIVITNV